jgi:hypothetical protein
MNQQINLYLHLPRPRKRFSAGLAIRWGLTAALICLLLIFVLQLRKNWGLHDQFRQLSQQEEQLKEALEQARKKIQALPSAAELDKEIQAVEKAISGDAQLLKEAEQLRQWQAEGFSGYLVHLGGKETSGLWLKRIVIGDGGGSLTLAGSALEPELIPRFIREMAEDQKFFSLKTAVLKVERSLEAPGRIDFLMEAGSTKRP